MILDKEVRNFAGKDETRPHLAYSHVSDNKEITTDGHRALIRETQLMDGVYLPGTVAKCSDEANVGVIKQLGIVPTGKQLKGVEIPLLFGSIKTKNSHKMRIYLNGDCSWTFSETKDSLVSLNPYFLREIAGRKVAVALSSPDSRRGVVQILLNETDYLLVMPLRF
jgi:hypothetical protein